MKKTSNKANLNIIEKDFYDGRIIVPIITIFEDLNRVGIGFKNQVKKYGDLQEGVIVYVPKHSAIDLAEIINENLLTK